MLVASYSFRVRLSGLLACVLLALSGTPVLAQTNTWLCPSWDHEGQDREEAGPGSTNRCVAEWTWMGGSTALDPTAVYGSIGASSPGSWPGQRYGVVTWTDRDGRLWLFGGMGFFEGWPSEAAGMNDLWRYDVKTTQWTWMSGAQTVNFPGFFGQLGTPSSSAAPPGRLDAFGWTDRDGNLWLMGGIGVAGGNWWEWGDFNDLWRYSPQTSEWAWFGGSQSINAHGIYGNLGEASPTNFPGARVAAGTWVDLEGNLWLYGGSGYCSNGFGYLNDVWKFDLRLSEWTWVGGSNTCDVRATYGTLGEPSSINTPGARAPGPTWTDRRGNLWMFGGIWDNNQPTGGIFNDIWRFDAHSLEWTWVGGANISNASAVFGTLGVPAPDVNPGALGGAGAWIDCDGNLWLYAGAHFYDWPYLDAALWKYDMKSGYWAWEGGTQTRGVTSVYGTMRVASPGNMPGSRWPAATWVDDKGRFWLYGGEGEGLTGGFGNLGDMWKLAPVDGEYSAERDGDGRCVSDPARRE